MMIKKKFLKIWQFWWLFFSQKSFLWVGFGHQVMKIGPQKKGCIYTHCHQGWWCHQLYNIEAKTTALPPSTDFLLHTICHSLFVAPENLDLIHSVESGGLSHSSTNSNTLSATHFIQIWYPPNSTTQVQNSDSKKLVWKSRFKWVVKFGTYNYQFIGDLLFFSQITGKYKRILWETHNYIYTYMIVYLLSFTKKPKSLS
jgi:hypothetical protein